MHDASAKIGIAIANRLPNIVLTANAGSTALAINQLFTAGHRILGSRRGDSPRPFSRAARCCTRNAPRRRPTCRRLSNIAARY